MGKNIEADLHMEHLNKKYKGILNYQSATELKGGGIDIVQRQDTNWSEIISRK